MELMRLVVTGAVGAGKSTFVRTASEIEVVDTDRTATDKTALLKKNTTVAMDFGKFTFGNEMTLHVYGTPGQARFNFMWEMLIAKANAYILLVAANRPEEFRYSRQILNFINQQVNIPMVLGITHTDCQDAWDGEDIACALGFHFENFPPILTVNPNDRTSTIEALIALVEHYWVQSTQTPQQNRPVVG